MLLCLCLPRTLTHTLTVTLTHTLIHALAHALQDGNSMDDTKLCNTLYGDADDITASAAASAAAPAAAPAAACIPGCYPHGQQCGELLERAKAKAFEDSGGHAEWTRGPYMPRCSYPPSQLQQALESNVWLNTDRTQMRHAHNEIVVDLRSVVAALPAAGTLPLSLSGE